MGTLYLLGAIACAVAFFFDHKSLIRLLLIIGFVWFLGLFVMSFDEHIDTEYRIELIDQNNVKIDNGDTIKTIPFDSIQSYMEKDNL